jgi:hypothetical protein
MPPRSRISASIYFVRLVDEFKKAIPAYIQFAATRLSR